jgi:hypothetical protein
MIFEGAIAVLLPEAFLGDCLAPKAGKTRMMIPTTLHDAAFPMKQVTGATIHA